LLSKIGDGQGLESSFTYDRAESGKVFGQRSENAKPVLSVVDFKALEGAEASVGRNERLGDCLHGATVGSVRAHLFIGRERLHHGRSHFALYLSWIHEFVIKGLL